MPMTIAVAGKGGTGKTTFSGMLIRHLADNKKGRILAVDADPNSNLNEVLGEKAPVSLGEIREDMLRKGADDEIPAGMTKPEYFEFMFGDALFEGDDFDLLVMGRTQGAGCYCFINGVLKTQIDRYAGGYSYVVADNEAGLEHISRGILPAVDLLLLVSDCSRRGVQAAGRAQRLVHDLKLDPKSVRLIINRAPGGEPGAGVMEEVDVQGLDLVGVLPHDEQVFSFDSDGLPSSNVPYDNPVKAAVREIAAKLGL